MPFSSDDSFRVPGQYWKGLDLPFEFFEGKGALTSELFFLAVIHTVPKKPNVRNSRTIDLKVFNQQCGTSFPDIRSTFYCPCSMAHLLIHNDPSCYDPATKTSRIEIKCPNRKCGQEYLAILKHPSAPEYQSVLDGSSGGPAAQASGSGKGKEAEDVQMGPPPPRF